METVFKINVNAVKTNPRSPRRDFSHVSELIESIKKNGLIQPIIIRSVNGEYEVVCGDCRLRALKELGYKELEINKEVLIKELDDKQAEDLMDDENIARKDYSPVELAVRFKARQKQGWTQTQIAKKYHVTQQRISQYLLLLGLDPVIQNKIGWGVDAIKGEIQPRVVNKPLTEHHARHLLQLKDFPQKQIEVAKLIEDKKLSSSATQAIVDKVKEGAGVQEAYETIFSTKENITRAAKEVADEVKRILPEIQEEKNKYKNPTEDVKRTFNLLALKSLSRELKSGRIFCPHHKDSTLKFSCCEKTLEEIIEEMENVRN